MKSLPNNSKLKGGEACLPLNLVDMTKVMVRDNSQKDYDESKLKINKSLNYHKLNTLNIDNYDGGELINILIKDKSCEGNGFGVEFSDPAKHSNYG